MQSNAKVKATILKHNGEFVIQHYQGSASTQAGQDHVFDCAEEAMLDFYKHDPRGELAMRPGSIVIFPSRDVMRWQGKMHGFVTQDAGKAAEYRWQGIKQAGEKAHAAGQESVANFLASI